MKAGFPFTVTLTPSRDVGATAPLKSPAVQVRVVCARFVPVISIYMFAEKPFCPKNAAAPELSDLIAGMLGKEILRTRLLKYSQMYRLPCASAWSPTGPQSWALLGAPPSPDNPLALVPA